MRNIIKEISLQSGLKYINVDENLDFAYYEDKDDFYLLCFYDHSDLMRITGENIKILEYALNNIVVNTKKSETLTQFIDRNINYNLSLILFAALDGDYPNLIKELNKVEENYINSKKYILPYNNDALEVLKEKISNTAALVSDLNDLAIAHSDSIQENQDNWYDLLLNLFIKIPYLNYQPADHSLTLTTLSDSLNQAMTDRESFLLSIINDSNIHAITDIENFVNAKNMTQ